MSATRPLSPTRQRRLVADAQRGDRTARDLLVTTNRGLVTQIAGEYAARGVEFEDLVQEGMLGLMRAVEKFDLKKPVRFSTYAAHWIRQGMGRACEQQGSTNRYGYRVPAHVTNAMGRIARTRGELERRLGREATPGELAAACEISDDAALQALRMGATAPAASLEDDDEGEGRSMAEALADDAAPAEDVIVERNRTTALREMLRRLPDAERELLEARYGMNGAEPVSERDLTAAWDTDRSQLQALRVSALRHLRRDPQVRELTDETTVPADMRDGVARGVMRQTCGHLMPGVRPEQLALDEVSKLSDRGYVGKVGASWWMVTQPEGAMQWQIRLLTDADSDDLLTPAQAATKMRGEQLIETSEWVSRMPLQHAESCCACAMASSC